MTEIHFHIMSRMTYRNSISVEAAVRNMAEDCLTILNQDPMFEDMNIQQFFETKCRKRKLVAARRVIMYFMREKMKMKLRVIGERFNRDHATALHNYNFVKKRMTTLQQFEEEYQFFELISKNQRL